MKNILRPKKTDHSAHLETGDFYVPVKIAFAVVRFGDFTIRLKLFIDFWASSWELIVTIRVVSKKLYD